MMKIKRWQEVGLLLGLVGALGGAASARASSWLYPDGVYGWYEVGPTLVADAKLERFFGETVTDNAVQFNPGFHFGIGFGQELTRYLRMEIETGYNFNSVDSISDATASTADLHRVPVFANLVWQFPNATVLTPVVGVGLGGHWLHFAAKDVALGTTTLDESSHTWSFGYQGYAGVRCELNERFSIGLFYHYQVADSPSWKFNSIPGTVGLNDVRSHSVAFTVGWMY